MKYLLIGFTFLTCLNVFSQEQKPETVYSIATEVKELGWYENQITLWKAEIDKNGKNGEAWTNYYAASRALRNLTHGSDDHKKYVDLCAKVPEEVQKAMPNTFESHFLTYVETEGAGGSSDELLKAAAISPYHPQILDELFIHYAVTRDTKSFDLYGKKMFESNYMPVGMLNWGYNLLSELDENAIIFTCGDNDTYSLWIAQAAKNFRKDVTVVNTSLILIDEYRNRLLKELGYDQLTLKTPESEEEYTASSKAIYEHFFKGKHPVYIATSTVSQFEKEYGEKLFLTGLAYKYSESSFDNNAIIRRNYENRYLLDYLKEVFSHNIGDLKGEEFNGMYLPSMIKLYQQYAESEEVLKKQQLEPLLLKIAEQSGKKGEVMELLSTKKK